jgi:hypothetical protein
MQAVEIPDELFAKLEAKSAKEGAPLKDIVEFALTIHSQDWGSMSYSGYHGEYYEVTYQSMDCLWDEFSATAEKLGLSVEQAMAELAKGHDGSSYCGKSAFFHLESLSHFLGDEIPVRFRGQLTIDDYMSRGVK